MRRTSPLILASLLLGSWPALAAPAPAPASAGAGRGELGNNPEAQSGARSCLSLLKNYVKGGELAPGMRVYLKLLAPEQAEVGLRKKAASVRSYRGQVEIAYLLIWVDPLKWTHASTAQRRFLATLPLNLLRSLYPRASVFLTVLDEDDPLAHSSWRKDAREPEAQVM